MKVYGQTLTLSNFPASMQPLTADLFDPVAGVLADRATLNRRHYIDVLFNDPNRVGLKPESIEDTTAEFTLRVNGILPANVTVIGKPVRQGTSNVWRYSFLGDLPEGEVQITFLPESWTDKLNIANASETQVFTAGTQFVDLGKINTDRFIDVTLVDPTGAGIKAATVNGGEVSLKINGVTPSGIVLGTPVRQGTTNVWRYSFTGSFTETGRVDVIVPPGTYTDLNGIVNLGRTDAFVVFSKFLTAPALNTTARTIDVTFFKLGTNALTASSITDDAPEFALKQNGQTVVNVVIGRTPTQPDPTGKPNTWRYNYTGTLPSGDIELAMLPFAFTDADGNLSPGTVAAATAQLANPNGGGSIQLTQLNGRQWIDVTFVSKDGSKIDQSTINGNEFKLSGSGVAQIKVDANGFPVLVGALPLLIQGSTYRYYLTDATPGDAVGLFKAGTEGPGEVLVDFVTAGPGHLDWGFKTLDGSVNAPNQERFTLDATGSSTAGGPLNIGPLTLQGPTIGIDKIGFKDGLLVLTVGIGADRASLSFGGSAPVAGATTNTTVQDSSAIKADLLGIHGSLDVAVDVLRPAQPGSENLRAWEVQLRGRRAECHRAGRRHRDGAKRSHRLRPSRRRQPGTAPCLFRGHQLPGAERHWENPTLRHRDEDQSRGYGRGNGSRPDSDRQGADDRAARR